MMKHPIIIAGPCSAETEEQVRSAAQDLKDFRLPASAGGGGGGVPGRRDGLAL